MKMAVEFLQSDLRIALVESELLEPVTGVKGKRFMSKAVRYNNEPIGEFKIVADFLPSPDELSLKNENTKVTISLSSESVAYFKSVAKEHHMQYQKIIRQLLDEYVAHQKRR
jgi:predicted DNA binding CopG/RHH family protein